MVSYFRDYVLSWWQIGLLKTTLFAAGLLVGTLFGTFLEPYIWFPGIVLACGVFYWVGWSIKNLSA